MTDAVAPIRVTVVGGYLGAGKTSLVNSVLRRADERVAVLVNDFGDVAIDTALIESNDGEVMRLANGCICCSLVDGFAAALDTVSVSEPRPDRLLIEASGVSDPAAVAAWGHGPGFESDAVVVVVDAETLSQRVRDRWVGDTVVRQIDAADVVVLNKVTLAGGVATASWEWLGERRPDVPVVETDHGEVALDVLFGPGHDRSREGHGGDPPASAEHAHSTETIRWDAAPMRTEIEDLMTSMTPSVVRAKGIVHLADEGPHVLQRVGPRWTLTPLDRPPPPDVEINAIVVISSRVVPSGPGPKGTAADREISTSGEDRGPSC